MHRGNERERASLSDDVAVMTVAVAVAVVDFFSSAAAADCWVWGRRRQHLIINDRVRLSKPFEKHMESVRW